MWGWEGRQRAALPAHDGHSSGLALRGDKAYSGGDDGLCKRWDLATQTCVDVMHGHEGAVWCVACDDDPRPRPRPHPHPNPNLHP